MGLHASPRSPSPAHTHASSPPHSYAVRHPAGAVRHRAACRQHQCLAGSAHSPPLGRGACPHATVGHVDGTPPAASLRAHLTAALCGSVGLPRESAGAGLRAAHLGLNRYARTAAGVAAGPGTSGVSLSALWHAAPPRRGTAAEHRAPPRGSLQRSLPLLHRRRGEHILTALRGGMRGYGHGADIDLPPLAHHPERHAAWVGNAPLHRARRAARRHGRHAPHCRQLRRPLHHARAAGCRGPPLLLPRHGGSHALGVERERGLQRKPRRTAAPRLRTAACALPRCLPLRPRCLLELPGRRNRGTPSSVLCRVGGRRWRPCLCARRPRRRRSVPRKLGLRRTLRRLLPPRRPLLRTARRPTAAPPRGLGLPGQPRGHHAGSHRPRHRAARHTRTHLARGGRRFAPTAL